MPTNDPIASTGTPFGLPNENPSTPSEEVPKGEVRFVQVAVVPMAPRWGVYGLTADGRVFFKSSQDSYWSPVSMRAMTTTR